MDILKTLISNQYLNAAVLSWFIAQVLKVVLTLIFTKEIKFERLVGNGGMPSSHSAFVTSLSIMVARNFGFSSVEFALVFAFAVVVMTDAMGVRHAAGEQAKIINKMVFAVSEFFGMNDHNAISIDLSLDEAEKDQIKDEEDEIDLSSEKRLKEMLGHTPVEVFAGMILGLIIGFAMPSKG